MRTFVTSKSSLITKITALILVAVYLPLVLIVWLLGAWLADTQMRQGEEMLALSLAQTVVNINAELQFIEQLAYSYAGDQRLAYFTHYEYSTSDGISLQLEAHEYLRDRLWIPELSRLSLERVMLFSDNSELLMSGGYLFPYNWLSDAAAALIQVSGYKGLWSTPGTPLLSGSGLITSTIPGQGQSVHFSRAVIWQNAPTRAIISMQMPLSILAQYLGNSSGMTWLLTPEGEVLTGTDTIDRELDTSVLEHKLNAGETHFVMAGTHGDIMLDAVGLCNGWRLIHAQPYELLLRETTRARALALGTALMMGVLFLILLGALWRVVIRRMRRLLEKMNLIQQGSFDLVPAPDPVPSLGHDELSTLDAKLTTVANDLSRLVQENYALILQRKDLELRALQAQINPHFLYNTLSTIKWMTLSHPSAQIREIVDAMSSFYRISLSNGEEIITLSEELRCTKAYLSIQRFRMMGRIQAHFDIDEALLDLRMPKLILQPLVENSIVHGPVEQQMMTLVVKVEKTDVRAVLTVTDDGRGMEPERAEELLTRRHRPGSNAGGYGLYNVVERLNLFYGDAVEMRIQSRPGEGTRVALSIPLSDDLPSASPVV